jgi:hypothetical protein
MTKTGMSVGTPHYMSPEQCRAEPLDGRSDFYSLGVLLYETLIGSKPFDADTSMAVALKQLQDPIPELPDNLARYQPLLDKMLAKDKDERIPNGAALVQLIDHILEEPETEPSYPQTAVEPEPEPMTLQPEIVEIEPESEPVPEPTQPEAEIEPEPEPDPPQPMAKVEIEPPKPKVAREKIPPEPEPEPPQPEVEVEVEPPQTDAPVVEVEVTPEPEPVPEPAPVPVAAAEKKSSALTISIPNRIAVPVLIIIMAVIFVYFFYQGLKKPATSADTPAKQTAELSAEKTAAPPGTVQIPENNSVVKPQTDTEDAAAEVKKDAIVKPKASAARRPKTSRVKPVEILEATAGRKPKALDDKAFREASSTNTIAAFNAYL